MGSMAREHHCTVTDTFDAPRIILGFNRIDDARRSTERSVAPRRSRPSDEPSAGTTPRGCTLTTGLVNPIYVTVTY
jgi:hypothetical protein